eukprot:m.165960 g.165960  ORF g.165960 m.165960 type:complete len:68 (+) comp21090_c0_seq2:71-274(+)
MLRHAFASRQEYMMQALSSTSVTSLHQQQQQQAQQQQQQQSSMQQVVFPLPLITSTPSRKKDKSNRW